MNAAKARYLVVGAYAVIFHSEPRFTKDLDLWVEPTPENAARVWQALAAFGAPLEGLTVQDLCQPTMVYQIGLEPNRIDIIMGLGSLDFARAWPRRETSSYGGEAIQVLGREDLIRAKEGAGRPQDLLDVQALRRAAQRGGASS